VELSRGAVVESAHRVDVVVAEPDRPVVVWGDARRPTIARSSLKFVQAIPLLTTGAADRFEVSAKELTLACASHSGEQAHLDAVAAWLERLGLTPDALECGPSFPIGKQAAIDHHRDRRPAAPIFHCCSGKHTGFLTVARHIDVDPAGYIEPGHPVQQLVTEAVEELTGHRLADQTPGRDGCGIPTYGIPLEGLAGAMSRLVKPGGPGARLVQSVVGNEFWISGTDRREVGLAAAASEPLLAKVGAEGVFMAGLPGRRLGIALKVHDGAERAADAAIGAVLTRLGVLPENDDRQPVLNAAGAVVGTMTVDASNPVLDRL
jgi:L-asparaginase II